MNELSTTAVILMAGLAFNFVGMIVGGLSFAFSMWRWLSQMKADMGQRLSVVETDVKHLLRLNGQARRAPARKRSKG